MCQRWEPWWYWWALLWKLFWANSQVLLLLSLSVNFGYNLFKANTNLTDLCWVLLLTTIFYILKASKACQESCNEPLFLVNSPQTVIQHQIPKAPWEFQCFPIANFLCITLSKLQFWSPLLAALVPCCEVFPDQKGIQADCWHYAITNQLKKQTNKKQFSQLSLTSSSLHVWCLSFNL